jgi:arylsulfatase A-like enzyme
VDLAPTFAELAGAAVPDFVDGRSLAPLLTSSPPAVSGWRQAFLIMHGEQDDDAEGAWRTNPLLEPPDEAFGAARAAAQAAMPPFAGLRTADYTYVEYDTGERELYDLRNDLYEMQNISASADRALVSRLSAWLATLSSCQRAACRSADLAPR